LPGRLSRTLHDLPHRYPRLRGFQQRVGALLLPQFKARHWERSLIVSTDDDTPPSERLLDVALEAASEARGISLAHLSEREQGPLHLADSWPGIHYRFLAGLVKATAATEVIEIGTATGLSALAMLTELPANGRLTTFDIVPWDEYPGTTLRGTDFDDGRLVQIIDDLSDPQGANRHREQLRRADIIFIDAKHDGIQEQRFLDNFESIDFEKPPLLVFDDIRQWDMLAFWRSVTRSKLDVTSLASWSGTGLVDWAG
jgi:predicted O-methyltransferase YrrM